MAERVRRVVQVALASVAPLVTVAVGHPVLAAVGGVATASIYDAPAFERADAQEATSVEGAFSVALAGDNAAPMPAASADDAATTPSLPTYTPRGTTFLDDATAPVGWRGSPIDIAPATLDHRDVRPAHTDALELIP